jgi:hypothetical protein
MPALPRALRLAAVRVVDPLALGAPLAPGDTRRSVATAALSYGVELLQVPPSCASATLFRATLPLSPPGVS